MEVREDVTYCSACFQGKPGEPHVDFGASWDGPVLADATGEPIQHTIDELIVCEDCLAAAVELLGYAKQDDPERIPRLEKALLDAEQRATRLEAQLNQARNSLGVAAPQDPPAPVKRRPGRPRKQQPAPA